MVAPTASVRWHRSQLAESGPIYALRNKLGSLAMLAAMRRASSRESRFVDICRCGSSSK